MRSISASSKTVETSPLGEVAVVVLRQTLLRTPAMRLDMGIIISKYHRPGSRGYSRLSVDLPKRRCRLNADRFYFSLASCRYIRWPVMSSEAPDGRGGSPAGGVRAPRVANPGISAKAERKLMRRLPASLRDVRRR